MAANTSLWEAQKAIVATLTSSTTFTSLVSNSIYDEPPTDQDYPYIVIANPTELSDNNLNRLGYEATITLYVYTRPYGLGWQPAYAIMDSMDEVLNVKKLTFTNGVSNLFIKKDGVMNEKESDKRILHCRYRFWTEQNSLHII